MVWVWPWCRNLIPTSHPRKPPAFPWNRFRTGRIDLWSVCFYFHITWPIQCHFHQNSWSRQSLLTAQDLKEDPSMLAKAGRALQCAWSLVQDWIPQRLLQVWSLCFCLFIHATETCVRHLRVDQLNATMSEWVSFKPKCTKATSWADPLRFPSCARRESAHHHAPDHTQRKWAWP